MKQTFLDYDYRSAKEMNCHVIDKTMLIKDLLDQHDRVTLITRPRRFGKTFNLSMLSEFFDRQKDSQQIFTDTKIMDTEYKEQMNQWPLIHLSFSSAKGSLQQVCSAIKSQILNAWDRNKEVFENLSMIQNDRFQMIYSYLKETENSSLSGIAESLSFLIRRMNSVYHKKVIVLIDEYDTPFIESFIGGWYEQIRNDLAGLLQYTLKDSSELQFAVMTGIQRVAKENIFSGLNNLKVCTVCDDAYSQYFGFTEEETEDMLASSGKEFNAEVRAMYDGYRFGHTDLYNPWSIMNYAQTGVLQRYWVNTSGNDLIRKALETCDETFRMQYNELIEEGSVTVPVSFQTSFFERKDNATLWGLFVNAGYLTIAEEINDHAIRKYRLVIPDDEVRSEFVSFTEASVHLRDNLLAELTDRLLSGNQKMFLKCYQEFLLSPSYHDLISENSYHMLMLGAVLLLKNRFEILSNRESGKGRTDLVLKALNSSADPSCILEFKYTKDQKKNLDKLAREGKKQCLDKVYQYGLKGTVYMVSLAHRGKDVAMEWETKTI